MPRGYTDLASYQLSQQQRRDQQFRDILNMMMMGKQRKTEQARWEQQQARLEQSATSLQDYRQQSIELERKRMKATEQYRQAQLDKPPTKTALEKKIDWAWTYFKGDEKRFSNWFSKNILSIQKTSFEEKKAALIAKLQDGSINQEQFDKAMFNIPPKPTPGEIIKKGGNLRQANDTWLKDVYKNAETKDILGEAKKAKARPIVRGIALDMPYKYNLAILNREDRVETPEDLDVIQKYDAMFQYFNDVLLPKANTFKKFTKLPEAKDPDFDRVMIRKWYTLYRKY